MKTFYSRLSQVSLKDWLEYHPYNEEAASDRFYINLCNDIQHEMLLFDVEDHLVGADYKYLACMLTCYFEDMVSETGIWTSFTGEHHKLYGKYLPFYDLEGYDPEDVNLADIQFLIWHFCSSLSVHGHFIDPFSIENTEIARMVYDMLYEAADRAPENGNMKAALVLAPDANIDEVSKHLDFFFFGCYLNRYYMTTLLQKEILDVKNMKGTQKDIDNRRVHLLFNRVSPLLAQRSGEMAACRAGGSHPLCQNLMSLSIRKEGTFLYIGSTDRNLQMKHIASGVLIDLVMPDWNFPMMEGVTVIRAGIVQWDGEWYAAGPVFPSSGDKNKEIAESEKCLFSQKASQLGIIRREEECFLEVSKNRRYMFLESKAAAFSFIDRVWETYHMKYGIDSKDRKMFDVYHATFDVDENFDNLVIFFNSRTGMEFYPNIAHCISIWDNPFFDIYAETHIESLIMDQRVSSEFIFFLIENQLIEIEPVSGDGGFHYVWANCDFLLRYWKKEKYVSEPELFIE